MITLYGSGWNREPNDTLHKRALQLAAKDATIWGDSAHAEAQHRLNWISLPETSRELLPQLDALAAWARERELTEVILCGMGGSSLAPEVIAKTYGKKLLVIDSTDPDYIHHVLPSSLRNCVVVIGSKSGTTVETTSHLKLFHHLFESQGLRPDDHMVIVTDPQSPLDTVARTAGYRIINADPDVGGRFSALSAFGLTPSALLGIDVSILLDDAYESAADFIRQDSPVIFATQTLAQLRYLSFTDEESTLHGLSDWIEQLIAESTGKSGKGILPVIVENREDSHSLPVVTFNQAGALSVDGALGSQFIFWEWVTALIGSELSIDPFNQPNVAEAKEQTNVLLHRWQEKKTPPADRLGTPSFMENTIEVFSASGDQSIAGVLASLFHRVPEDGYIAILAYLNRCADFDATSLRGKIAALANRPTTFGWGPRFLHSTGQFHKGGPLVGGFILITGEPRETIEIPGSGYDFQTLITAQALGDLAALRSRGLPVVHFHLRNREAGIKYLHHVVDSLNS